MNPSSLSNKSAIAMITVISAGASAFLIWLIYFKSASHTGIDVSFLSTVNATCNALSAICLLIGILAIKQKKVNRHRQMMISAFVFSTIFLISYIIYHHFHGDTLFEGQGIIRPIYFFILITHIFLSIVALPMILVTFYFALIQNFIVHPKVAKFTFPLWFYVSVTGVIIYFMLKIYS